MWTGKPNDSIEGTINDYAENGWRLVQIVRPNYYNWGGGINTELVFEKTMENYMKDRRNYREVGEFV